MRNVGEFLLLKKTVGHVGQAVRGGHHGRQPDGLRFCGGGAVHRAPGYRQKRDFLEYS